MNKDIQIREQKRLMSVAHMCQFIHDFCILIVNENIPIDYDSAINETDKFVAHIECKDVYEAQYQFVMGFFHYTNVHNFDESIKAAREFYKQYNADKENRTTFLSKHYDACHLDEVLKKLE